MTTRRSPVVRIACVITACSSIAGCTTSQRAPIEASPPSVATPDSLDLSGLAWLGFDLFLAVHDSKEGDRGRLSVIELPGDEDAGQVPEARWRNVDVDWPSPGPPVDMESAARVPGTGSVLVAESGQESDDDGSQFKRIFVMQQNDGSVRLRRTVEWPTAITNVEGAAVALVGKRLVFLYAERAQGEATTEIRWATLKMDPISFGKFREATLRNPSPVGPQSRPVSAIDVDDDGNIYVASAIDPDTDNGPYTSSVWRVGKVRENDDGKPEIVIHDRPTHLATADGFKIESVAVRASDEGKPQVFVGTDDENYGGTLRPLPAV